MFRGEKSSDWISSSSIRAIFFMDFFLFSGSTEPEGGSGVVCRRGKPMSGRRSEHVAYFHGLREANLGPWEVLGLFRHVYEYRLSTATFVW